MRDREYEAIARREESHFWHVARREVLGDVLRRHLPTSSGLSILDAGCGPGGNILFLKDFGEVSGLDISDTALKIAAQREYRALYKSDASRTPLTAESFDLVASLDMLEHIEDDAAVLREFHRLLRKGGYLLLAVPAHQWLWSRHDRVLGHYRRYQKQALLSLLGRAGFEAVRTTHFILPAVPSTFARKTIDALTGADAVEETYDFDPSPAVNKFLLGLLRLEKRYLASRNLPIGTSLLVLAKKS